MRDTPSAGNMTGSLLIAHPNLRDPNFRRTIVFLSHHQADDGAIGLVLNRPLKKTMADLSATPGETAALPRVPVFYGGPVEPDDILLASMQWQESPSALAFRGFGRIKDEPVIPPEFQPGLRAWKGYSGWSRGQLESEIAEKAWILLPPTRPLIEMSQPDTVWHEVMRHLGPMYRLLAGMPDDPERN